LGVLSHFSVLKRGPRFRCYKIVTKSRHPRVRFRIPNCTCRGGVVGQVFENDVRSGMAPDANQNWHARAPYFSTVLGRTSAAQRSAAQVPAAGGLAFGKF